MQGCAHFPLVSDVASMVARDGTYLALALAGWLTVSFVFQASVRLPGKPAKTSDDETSEASTDLRPGLAEEGACAPDGLALLEYYGVLGAPCGSWDGGCGIAAEADELSLDEVSDYFQAALNGELVYVEASAQGQPSPSWTSLDEPSSDESLQPVLDEAYGVFGAPCGSWNGRDIEAESEASVDEVSDHFRPSPSWTSLDEPFLDEALQLLAEASANLQQALASESGDASSSIGLLEQCRVFAEPCGSWIGHGFAAEAEPSLDEVSDYPQPTPSWMSLDRPSLDEPFRFLLDEASGLSGTPCGSWSGRDIEADAEASVDEVSDHFRPSPSWTNLDEPFLDEALQLLVEASANCQPPLAGKSVDACSGMGAPCGSWSGHGFAAENKPSLDEISDYFKAALAHDRVAGC